MGAEDMGHFGVSCLELLFEQWAGHRLLNGKVIRSHLRAHRPISFSSVLYQRELKLDMVVSS